MTTNDIIRYVRHYQEETGHGPFFVCESAHADDDCAYIFECRGKFFGSHWNRAEKSQVDIIRNIRSILQALHEGKGK